MKCATSGILFGVTRDTLLITRPQSVVHPLLYSGDGSMFLHHATLLVESPDLYTKWQSLKLARLSLIHFLNEFEITKDFVLEEGAIIPLDHKELGMDDVALGDAIDHEVKSLNEYNRLLRVRRNELSYIGSLNDIFAATRIINSIHATLPSLRTLHDITTRFTSMEGDWMFSAVDAIYDCLNLVYNRKLMGWDYDQRYTNLHNFAILMELILRVKSPLVASGLSISDEVVLHEIESLLGHKLILQLIEHLNIKVSVEMSRIERRIVMAKKLIIAKYTIKRPVEPSHKPAKLLQGLTLC